MNAISKRKALIYLSAVFIAGLVAGVVAGGLIGFRLGAQHLTRPPGPDQMAADIKQRLRQDLHLSETQVEQISPVVDAFVKEMDTVHSNTVEQCVQLIRKMHQRVETFLDPKQKARFKSIQQAREAEFRRRARPPGN